VRKAALIPHLGPSAAILVSVLFRIPVWDHLLLLIRFRNFAVVGIRTSIIKMRGMSLISWPFWVGDAV
jgi:hypothetical protein